MNVSKRVTTLPRTWQRIAKEGETMMTHYKPVEDPHKAQEALLVENCNTLHSLRLAIGGLADENDGRGLMAIHDLLRDQHKRIFEIHDWLENARDEEKPKTA